MSMGCAKSFGMLSRQHQKDWCWVFLQSKPLFKRMRFSWIAHTRLSTQECPLLLQSLKERTLIPHPSSNGFRAGIYFEVTQHQEFITSFWNVGENGHSNKTAKGLQYQKQQQSHSANILLPKQCSQIKPRVNPIQPRTNQIQSKPIQPRAHSAVMRLRYGADTAGAMARL